jgi:hypothetical protein
MLLGEDEPAPSPLRAQLWRMKQWTVIAAVMFLAMGLSALVLQVLKGASKPAHIATIDPIINSTTNPPPAIPVIPATLPAQIAVVITPETQPVVQLDSHPTTDPVVSADAFEDIGDELGVDTPPATQPVEAADTQGPTTAPATMPVADDGDDK